MTLDHEGQKIGIFLNRKYFQKVEVSRRVGFIQTTNRYVYSFIYRVNSSLEPSSEIEEEEVSEEVSSPSGPDSLLGCVSLSAETMSSETLEEIRSISRIVQRTSCDEHFEV